jgi:hypothetical protein
MLTEEEKVIVKQLKSEGYNTSEITSHIGAKRLGVSSNIDEKNLKEFKAKQAGEKPLSNRIAEGVGLGGAVDVFGNLIARSQATEAEKQFIEKPTPGQIAGAALQTAVVPAGMALTGGASLPAQVAVGAGLGYAYDVGQDLVEKNSVKDTITPGAGTIIGGLVPPIFKGFSSGIGALKKPVTEATQSVAEKIALSVPKVLPDSLPAPVEGVLQKGKDLAERVPRFVGRVQENLAESAVKAERIKTAPTKAIQEALKVDLPEKYINTIPQADKVTKEAYKRVLDIADETPTTIGVKKNPTIVGGELAGKEYDVIETQRKKISEEMNKVFAELPKERTVDMTPAYNTLDSVLGEQGIVAVPTKKGITLDFSRSNLAPKQRTVVEQLYKLAREAGDTMSPAEVHKKDQLFSAMQRESKADQIEDVLINTPDGKKISLFRVFRDVFNGQLDSFTPEIKKLNTQYRNISTLIDDIEDSIFKTPNFNVTKSANPAEFAKVNLRRIFGESQSSPAYEAIADEMDTVARSLGYTDASPKEIVAFAQEVRELYPESVPRTGFQGGFTRIMDIAEKVLGAGKSDVADQRKALRALIEENAI